jgi:hypothetical protein
MIRTSTNQPIAANRITVKPQVGDTFFCFSLKQRPPEGAVLSRAQLEAIGYQWNAWISGTPPESLRIAQSHLVS